MQTPIGRQLGTAPRRLVIASLIGAVAIIGDLVLVWWNQYDEGRWLIALVVLVVYVQLVRGDLDSVGLTLQPVQGWGYWMRATLLIGLVVLICIAVGWSAWLLSSRPLPIYSVPPRTALAAFFRMCVFAPVLEETIYRLALCVPFAGLSRPWLGVVVSGFVFGGLHIVYGNPSPENLLGGFFLAWAYLKSGSIYMPVVLHSIGNSIALAGQIATWYWLQGSA